MKSYFTDYDGSLAAYGFYNNISVLGIKVKGKMNTVKKVISLVLVFLFVHIIPLISRTAAASLFILLKFICIWSIIIILFFIIDLNFYKGFNSYIIGICPPDFWYVLKKTIGSAVFAGMCEEPLFRSFIILVLIGYTVYPAFAITHIDLLQLLSKFILGKHICKDL